MNWKSQFKKIDIHDDDVEVEKFSLSASKKLATSKTQKIIEKKKYFASMRSRGLLARKRNN